MKAKLFNEFLLALTDLFASAGINNQSAAWLAITPIFDVSGSVKDVCKRLCDLTPSTTGEGPRVSDLILAFPALGKILRQTAKQQTIADFNLFTASVTPFASRGIHDLVNAMTKRSGTAGNISEIVDEHLKRLESTLADEVAFLAAFNALKGDKLLKAPDVKQLGRAFTKQGSKSKADALQRIWDRHASLLAAGARAKATGDRTAA
jgi:hypothetical protein